MGASIITPRHRHALGFIRLKWGLDLEELVRRGDALSLVATEQAAVYCEATRDRNDKALSARDRIAEWSVAQVSQHAADRWYLETRANTARELLDYTIGLIKGE